MTNMDLSHERKRPTNIRVKFNQISHYESLQKIFQNICDQHKDEKNYSQPLIARLLPKAVPDYAHSCVMVKS